MDRVVDIDRRNGVARVQFLSGDILRVPSALFLERRLRVGELMDPAAYQQFMLERGYPHALEAAMKFLALRERSRQEVRARLLRSCYDEATIAHVLDSLELHDLVSDERFASQWVTARARKYGRGRIAQELKMKGVDNAQMNEALSQLSEEDELQKAIEQAGKLSRRMQGNILKITQALVRRGYSWSLARKAAEASQQGQD